jgi:3-hydroxyisobutyrate dehydrogenase-like beta-hydroxyacid dehydrogenase
LPARRGRAQCFGQRILEEASMPTAGAAAPLAVGYIGVGLMGHGAAKNILQAGHKLTILGHRNRAPVEDLVSRGALEAETPAKVAAASDVVFLCLPSSVEVEDMVTGAGGLLAAMKPGSILVDSTTADPHSTRRLGALLAARGVGMVDGPVGRTPKEAEEGKLSTFLGGDAAHVARVKPIVATYADTIIDAGELGAGHTLKLVNNFISIGTATVISEALATAAKLGVDLNALNQVVSAGGANSRMWQMMIPWALEGDDSHLRGPLRIAGKDMRFWCRLAEGAGTPAFIGETICQTYRMANALGHGDRFMPVLPQILAQLMGSHIRDLPPA